MRQTRHYPAHEIEEQIFEVAQYVLHVIPEDPQIEHIAEQMEPASVQEHSGENR
jgi:hypothetical protein